MDRFKFRVWNKDDETYEETTSFDCVCIDNDGQLRIHNYSDASETLEDYTDSYIIEQCTGLKDKNGNLIYEGDIVKDSLLGRKYTVNWDCDNVQFEALATIYDSEFCEVYGLYVDSVKELEIVGNIHEQKEEQ